MHFVRSAVIFVLTTLLPSLLIATVLSAVLWQVFGSRERLSDTIERTGVYDAYLPIFEEPRDTEPRDNSVPMDEAARREISQKALTPDFRRDQVETFINGTYDWLEEKTAKPAFTLEFSALKTNLANALGDYGEERVAGLPVCPSNAQTSEVDAFSISCRPPNLSASAIGEEIRQDFVSSDDFLQDTSVDASEIGKDEEGKSTFDRLSELPQVFKLLRVSQIALPLITVFVAAGIVLISNDRLRSLRRIGLVMLVIGGFMLLATFFTRTGMERVRSAALNAQADARGKAYASVVVDIFEELAVTAGKVGRIYGGAYAAIGAIALVSAVHFAVRRAHTLPREEQATALAEDTPSEKREGPEPRTAAPVEKQPPKKPRPPRLIQ
jgi:hypothetical protein